MDCGHGYFANRGGCWPCTDSNTAMRFGGAVSAVAVFGTAAGALAAFMWYRDAVGAGVGFAGEQLALRLCLFWLVAASSFQLVVCVSDSGVAGAPCAMRFCEVGFSWKQSRALQSCCRPASFGRCCHRFPHLKSLKVVSAALLTGK